MKKFVTPFALFALLTLFGAVPVLGQAPGESGVFIDRVIVELSTDGDTAVELSQFITAFENDPAHPGALLTELAAMPGRPIHLLALTMPAGSDPMALDLAHRYPELVAEGELLCECDAPEGGTGSTYVDGFGLTPDDFGNQYARPGLGLDAANEITRGQGITVAVLDTGVDVTHPLLAGRIAPGGWDVIDDSADVRDLGDGLDSDGDGAIDEMVGHGTFVAGLVTLVAPEAGIIPIRVLDGDGIGDAWTVAAGIYRAIDAGADVINLSLRSTLESEIVEDALDAARQHGIVAVSAAGNFDRAEPKEYPAMEDLVIGVAAVDDLDVKTSFSNFNEDLFISAPGGSVADADAAELDRSIISALPGGGYAIWEGTSMATPLVAGAAALVLAAHPEWEATEDGVDLVRAALALSAADIDPVNPDHAGMLGAGRLDVAAALSVAEDLSDEDVGVSFGRPASGDRFEPSAAPRGLTPAELAPESTAGR